MKHFDDDTILKFVLELLDDEESVNITEHLTKCEICTAKLRNLEKQNKLIASYNPTMQEREIQKRENKINCSVWLKRAAVLLLGFLLGYSTSIIFQQNQVVISGQQFITKSPTVGISNFTQCPNVDIYRIELVL